MTVTVHHGDSRDVLKTLADASIDSVVCDPPYALVSIGKRFGRDGAAPAKAGKTGAYARASAGFMGKSWDVGDTAFALEFWAEVYRVLKPGGHVVAFSGTRTYHRLACAIEDAGFEIRDQLAWAYASGFPKSHDVSKGVDKHLGAERTKVRIPASRVRNQKATGGGKDGTPGAARPYIDLAHERGFHEAASPEAASPEAASWIGWGTALKPAWEPICLARKGLGGTVAANVLAHGTGALNIDGCRVGWQSEADAAAAAAAAAAAGFASTRARGKGKQSPSIGKESRDGTNTYDPTAIAGRWPANLLHDGSDEVVEAFPISQDGVAVQRNGGGQKIGSGDIYSGQGGGLVRPDVGFGGGGSAARFFFSAKADSEDRHGSKHPTVKPVDVMAWLCRLVTPPGGTILDPFAGTGSTGIAALREGFDCVLIEREDEYVADINRRLAWVKGDGRLTVLERARDIDPGAAAGDDLPLFATQDPSQPASQPASVSSTGPSPATSDRPDGDDEMVAA